MAEDPRQPLFHGGEGYIKVRKVRSRFERTAVIWKHQKYMHVLEMPVQTKAKIPHGELCPDRYDSYCFNGGTCYILISTPFCWCNNSFKGNRCQEFLLPSQQPERTVSSLLVILIVVSLLVVILVITGRTYCYCRKRRQKRRKERGRSLYHVVARHRSIDIG